MKCGYHLLNKNPYWYCFKTEKYNILAKHDTVFVILIDMSQKLIIN